MGYFKLSLILIISLLTSACQLSSPSTASSLTINGQSLQVELALTDQQKFQGLSGRAALCSDCGLLFVFDKATRTSFVMRDMNFPLDLVGIRDNQVVAIDENAQPEQGPDFTLYQNQEPVDQVLELNAGAVNRLQIKIGDSVSLDSAL